MDNRELELAKLRSAEQLHRFEAKMLFGQMTVFLAVNTALLWIVIHIAYLWDRMLVAAMGIALSVLFSIIHYRIGLNLRGARSYAQQLADELSLPLYTRRRAPDRGITGTDAPRFMCGFVIVAWLIVFFRAMVRL